MTGGNTNAIAPSWSPDGRRLAYVQAQAPPSLGPQFSTDNVTGQLYMGQRRIWVADASGAKAPYSITSDNRYGDEEPLWSADGTYILFCRLSRSGAGSLWLMGTGGENPMPLSNALPLKNLTGLDGYIDWRGTFDWHR